ncbi:WAS/WASL-interacting protein family member 3-like isoform X2 [Tyto alba]|uniref:WAS/WASL-interacting protein family member 3-like isoform X2 n=1 Tax=Tyto alba TaxID=56313 RepID=UPI001C67781A|nr:WAS/WASL-interacting protein family member 3-like isoform X2 [Tyto alba]
MSKEAFEVLLQPLFTASAYSRAAFPKNLIMLFGEVPRTTQEMRLLAMVMRLLTSMLVGNLWAILEKVMQLCSWVPGRRLREMARVFPTGGLFQLLGWIRRKSLAGIPGRPTQWLCRSRRFQEEAVAHCPPLPQQGRRCKQRSKSKESVIFPPLLPCMAARGPCSGEESLCPSCSRVPQRPPLSTDMPLHLGDTGWKPAGTPCARSAPPATPASLTAGTNTSSRSPRLKHRHVHPPWPPLPLVPPAQAPSEKAPLTPEPAGPALCQGLEAAPPG